MKILKFVLLLFVSIIFSSCATQTHLLTDNPQKYNEVLKESGTDSFFIAGVGQTKIHNVSEVCGDGYKAARVTVRRGVAYHAFAILTLGIYSPKDYEIYCVEDKEEL